MMRHWYSRILLEFLFGIFMMFLWMIIWTYSGLELPSLTSSTSGFILTQIIGGIIAIPISELVIKIHSISTTINNKHDGE